MQSARWTWGGGPAAVLLLGSLAVAQTPAGEIDWRSRAEVGLVVQYAWELENTSTHPSGGGNGYEEHGTLVDRVYAEEDGDFLGVRSIARTNGSTTRTELRFFRLGPGGERVDDAELGSFVWLEARDDFPHHDPLGTSAEFQPGESRERSVTPRDPLLSSSFPDPVTVREVVSTTIPPHLLELYPDPRELDEYVEHASRADPDFLYRTVERSWESPDEEGLARSDGKLRLLSLHETSTFNPRTNLLLERELRFSFLWAGNPMIQGWRRVLRETSSDVEPVSSCPLLPLREAYRLALIDPRAARRRLDEWSRERAFGVCPAEEIAAQIWLIASRAERDHASAVRIARERGPAAEASLAIDEDESCEALRRGRLTQLFQLLELDGARHRTAYRAHLERLGHDHGRIEFLLRVHDGAPRPPEWSLPASLRPQGAPLLERSLRELGD